MAIKVVAGAGAGASGSAENCRGPARQGRILQRKGQHPLLFRDGVPDHEDVALPVEEDTAVACVQRAPVPAVGLRGAGGGRRHEAGHVDVGAVAKHPQHRGAAVELAEAATEAGVGDEAAPAPADERGADEVRGLVRRQAEEPLSSGSGRGMALLLGRAPSLAAPAGGGV